MSLLNVLLQASGLALGYLGAAIGAGLGAIGAGLGIGNIGRDAMSAIARQPIEGVALFAIVECLLVAIK